MAFWQVLIPVFLAVSISIYCITTFDQQWHTVTLQDIGSSKFSWISPLQLGIIRLLYCLIIWYTLQFTLLDSKGIEISVIDGNGKPVKLLMRYGERFTMFTVWSFVLQGIYFVLATIASFSAANLINYNDSNQINQSILITSETTGDQSLLIRMAWVLLEVSFVISFIVSGVVTYILIPGAKRSNLPIHNFFKWTSQLMHNANVIFMASEMILSRIPFHVIHIPYIALYGSLYAIFAWIWFHHRGVFYYFFLNYNRPDAYLWYWALLIGCCVLFGVAIACSMAIATKSILAIVVRKEYLSLQ